MSHIVQGCNSHCVVGFSTLLPILLVFLVITIGFVMGFSFEGMFETSSSLVGVYSGLRVINHVEVMCVTPIGVGGTRYQTGITNDKFGRTTMAMTCCDTKLAGGKRKGVWEAV